MKIQIMSDLSGRLRIRYDRFAFDSDRDLAVEQHFLALPYVHSARANAHTGSVLLCYEGDHRDDVLVAARALIPRDLAVIADTQRDMMRSIDDNFWDKLLGRLFGFAVRRLLLPIPIRNVLTLVRAARFIWKGLRALTRGELAVEVLDAAAIGASILQGNFATASSVMFLLSLSELIERYTMRKTKGMLSTSLILNTEQVWVVRGGTEVCIPIGQLTMDDRVVVRAGSVMPVDGEVLSGSAVVNESAMTGEPLGVPKEAGNSVFAGTVVEEGAVTIRVRALQDESRISKIVELISESEDLKASVQGKAERFADRIVPFSFLLFFATLAISRSITKAVSVLMVDYSCAIKLATPIAVLSAMREASELGIVVKGGKFLEAMAEADTVVFDKTGTLTLAAPKVSRVIPVNGFQRDDVLRLAACMEEHFPHSVARAVVEQALLEGLRHEEEHAEVNYIVAHGISTTIHGRKAIIGSHHFVFEDERTPLAAALQTELDAAIGSDSAIYLAIGDTLAGVICISDPPRAEAAEVIRALRETGVSQVVMLTGDTAPAAEQVSRQLGIDYFQAQVLPEDKARIVQQFKADGHRVIMIGDGINDSPALAAADVSVSMEDASDIARQVADITLRHADLYDLVTARRLAQALMRRIQRNFAIIVGFNSSLLALGLFNVIAPGTSALLHNLSTISISALSMRPCLPSAPEQEIQTVCAQTAEAIG
ncbi:MAG: heavy metal translocating P-type ATPase [Oscillospiraceae bacterium]|nr:heavy metal translocating P-type ATPase [Oscillospiraceae bacterium]